jgi:hypothetical protein
MPGTGSHARPRWMIDELLPIQSLGRLMSPATWMRKRTPTSTYLAGIIVVFVVAALYWCMRKSVVVVPDLVIEGELVTPTLTLFQRINWLWSCLFVLPALYLGAAGFRASVLCGSLAYGIGAVLGWWVAESGIVLADPLLRPQLERMLAQGFGFAAAWGAAFVVVGYAGRRVMLWVYKKLA